MEEITFKTTNSDGSYVNLTLNGDDIPPIQNAEFKRTLNSRGNPTLSFTFGGNVGNTFKVTAEDSSTSEIGPVVILTQTLEATGEISGDKPFLLPAIRNVVQDDGK